MIATADLVPQSSSHYDGRDLLRVVNVSKRYGATEALRGVTLHVSAGEAVAIVGENGAGKSTLVRVIAGLVPDRTFRGELWIEGRRCAFDSVTSAEAQGVVLIPQELEVAPALSVTENMLAGHFPRKWGVLKQRTADEVAQYWLTFFGLDCSPSQPIDELAPSEQRVVVISGALARRARILILDEPTVSLTTQEAERLFARLQQLRSEGTAILYITHALDEIEQVADRVVVLRNGERVDEMPARPIVDRPRVIRAMLGRELSETRRTTPRRQTGWQAPPALEVKELTVFDTRGEQRPRVRNVSFVVHAGEILGLFGVIGSGAPETAAALCGAWAGRVEGEVAVGGWQGRIRSPRHAVARGIATLTGDRQSQGVIQGQSVDANISASSCIKFPGGIINRGRESIRNAQLLRSLRIVAPSLGTPIDSLSGGNQQKVLLARCLAVEPEVMILEEPTLGIDVGSRMEIYGILHQVADQGAGLLMISSDVGEVDSQCDRILVFRRGQVVAERLGGCGTEELVHLATGGQFSA